MTELSAMEPFDEQLEAVEDYRQQARDFLARSWVYLQENDLHQASEKGWSAAAWMAKAVAEAQGWQYRRHDEFFPVVRSCQELAGDDRLRHFASLANMFHGFYYTRKRLLNAETIRENLTDIQTMLDILEPLTALEEQAAD